MVSHPLHGAEHLPARVGRQAWKPGAREQLSEPQREPAWTHRPAGRIAGSRWNEGHEAFATVAFAEGEHVPADVRVHWDLAAHAVRGRGRPDVDMLAWTAIVVEQRVDLHRCKLGRPDARTVS